MSILIPCLYVVEVIVCLLLAMVVMLQKPKEGGLGGAIGGGMLEASLGADAGNVLIKTTAVLGVIFLVNTLVLAKLTSSASTSVTDGISEAPVAEQGPDLTGAALPISAPAGDAVPAGALPVTNP